MKTEIEEYLWCNHCTRGYLKSEIRQVGIFQKCAYPDCDASAVMDGFLWEPLHLEEPGRFPKVPEKGVGYPMYKII